MVVSPLNTGMNFTQNLPSKHEPEWIMIDQAEPASTPQSVHLQVKG